MGLPRGKGFKMPKLTCLLPLMMLVSACATARDADVICRETEAPAVALASLKAEMTDAVALAAVGLIEVLDAGCAR